MKKMMIMLFLGLWVVFPSFAQDQLSVILSQLSEMNDADSESAQATVDTWWEGLQAEASMPIVSGDQVLFLYKGTARGVEWRGDFSGWDTDPIYQGIQVGETDLWWMLATFPSNGRFEYKIVVNGSQWMIDPANPNQAMGGFGANNNLLMPDYQVTDITEPRDGAIAQGVFYPPILISSDALGYTLNYRVYTPDAYDGETALPVLYVLDGNDFGDAQMGRMIAGLDYLIADGMSPLIAVFIDARQPRNNNNNRRQDEFVGNREYARFIAEELVPAIDANYATQATAEGRIILGTSLGGLASGYIGALYPDVFDNIVMYSPAFWVMPELVTQTADAEDLPSHYFVGAGYPDWDVVVPAEFLQTLEDRGITLQYMETVEGHNWGNWRGMFDETFAFLMASE